MVPETYFVIHKHNGISNVRKFDKLERERFVQPLHT